MYTFDHIRDWQLKGGSHEFPGPDGGTCINEAALVAAGLPYQSISSSETLPPCFSYVLSTYALKINDLMPDDDRQKLLLPFVTRLVGTRDTPDVEQQRTKHIIVTTLRELVPVWLRGIIGDDVFRTCQIGDDSLQLAKQLIDVSKQLLLCAMRNPDTTGLLEHFALALLKPSVATRVVAVHGAAQIARCASYSVNTTTSEVWAIAASVLDGACRIGKQPDPLDIGIVQQRMQKAKQAAMEPCAA